jgi:hypothetical protein
VLRAADHRLEALGLPRSGFVDFTKCVRHLPPESAAGL